MFSHPQFFEFFQAATPVRELAELLIGSRPASRSGPGGVQNIRAIPWVFGWTQTRFHLPVWLGIGEALAAAFEEGNQPLLEEMLREWPFFQSTLSLVDMVLLKLDSKIASRYMEVLAATIPGAGALKDFLLTRAQETHIMLRKLPIQQHAELLAIVEARLPYIDPLNLLQVECLRRLRAFASAFPPSDTSAPTAEQTRVNEVVRDTMLVTIQGIAAGMQNTG